MSRALWIGALGLAAVAALWLYSEFERVPDKSWMPASGEARLRPFLAAERFAERRGMRARELRALPELDGDESPEPLHGALSPQPEARG